MNQKRTHVGSEKPTGIEDNPWGSIRTSINKRELVWAHKNLQKSKRIPVGAEFEKKTMINFLSYMNQRIYFFNSPLPKNENPQY